jgi:hypothetical protein
MIPVYLVGGTEEKRKRGKRVHVCGIEDALLELGIDDG